MKLHYLISLLKHPKITYLTSLLLLLELGLSQPLLAQKNWTGAAGTSDWNTASNWNPAGVPTITDDVTIQTVSSPRLYPTIIATDVTAKLLYINTFVADLTIANMGKSTFNGAGTGGKVIDNAGTFENNGQLVLEDASGLGTVGILNAGAFKNNAGAVIAVNNFSEAIISGTSTFINAGTINISTRTHGIRIISGSFDNMLGGIITIDNFSNTGISLSAGTFRNYATITIGATAVRFFWGE